MRNKLGMPINARPWTSLPHVQCRFTPREADAVDVAYFKVLARARGVSQDTSRTDLVKSLFVNASQNVDYSTVRDVCPCIGRNAHIYSFERDCWLTGLVLLRSLGWNKRPCSEGLLSNAQLRELAGDGYSAPTIGALIYMFALNEKGPWWVRSGARAGSGD